MTIHEKRMKEIERLSKDYNIPLEIAKNISNRYYRLCGLYSNYNRVINSPHYKAENWKYLEENIEKSFERLMIQLNTYNLYIVFCSYLPTICEKNTTRQAFNEYFYN